jgi:hypothetical protein
MAPLNYWHNYYHRAVINCSVSIDRHLLEFEP